MQSHDTGLLYLLLHWIVSAVAILITAYLVKGFQLRGFFSALVAAVAIGFANTVIWPILAFLTFPLTILTLGLFLFVVNGMVLKICAAVLPGFEIKTWTAAIFGAIILSVVSSLLHYVLV